MPFKADKKETEESRFGYRLPPAPEMPSRALMAG